jgi:hypothetical protein
MLFICTYSYSYNCDLKDEPVNLPDYTFNRFLYEIYGSIIIYRMVVKVRLSL